jgi:hypothetical protein
LRLKRALIAAKSISHSNPAFGGASGVHFGTVIERYLQSPEAAAVMKAKGLDPIAQTR